jgi:hypothetical protein
VYARWGALDDARRIAKRLHNPGTLLDELFASEDLSKVQRRGAAALDALGTDWTDERW